MKPGDRSSWLETLRLSPPSLSDNTADQERLIGALQKRLGDETICLDADLLADLPTFLRRWDFSVHCALVPDGNVWHVCCLAGIEDDPKAMGKLLRQMSSELGDEAPAEFDEVVDRLESGQKPEDIEKDLPDLGGGLGGSGDDL